MKAWPKSILLLRNDEKQIVADCNPDLRVYCIYGCALEGLDVKMLLDPLEEDLNLPSLPVEVSDSEGTEVKVVGHEPIDSPIPKVLIDNEPEVIGMLPGSVVAGKADGLVGQESSFTSISSITLESCTEASVRRMKSGMEPFKSIRECILNPPFP